jgi:hypothetical protein
MRGLSSIFKLAAMPIKLAAMPMKLAYVHGFKNRSWSGRAITALSTVLAGSVIYANATSDLPPVTKGIAIDDSLKGHFEDMSKWDVDSKKYAHGQVPAELIADTYITEVFDPIVQEYMKELSSADAAQFKNDIQSVRDKLLDAITKYESFEIDPAEIAEFQATQIKEIKKTRPDISDEDLKIAVTDIDTISMQLRAAKLVKEYPEFKADAAQQADLERRFNRPEGSMEGSSYIAFVTSGSFGHKMGLVNYHYIRDTVIAKSQQRANYVMDKNNSKQVAFTYYTPSQKSGPV